MYVHTLYSHLEWRLSPDMRYEKVHGNVLTVHILVHCVPHLTRHPIGIEVGIVLDRKGVRYILWLFHVWIEICNITW